MMGADASATDPDELVAQKQQKIALHNARINAINNSKGLHSFVRKLTASGLPPICETALSSDLAPLALQQTVFV